MSKKHRVIVIPGLGDNIHNLSLATRHWHRYHLDPIIHAVGWYDGENFQPKLQTLVEMIDQYAKNGDRISLVGCSAGASAVLNAFFERRALVHRVIAVCGRLKNGDGRGFRSFANRTATSQSFAESVQLFESREPILSNQERKKIMTVRALFGDELVPADTAILHGAYNTVIPTVEHVISIALALTFFSHPLISFLTQDR